MRDFTNWDKYLTRIAGDIYPQPEDEEHYGWAKFIINKWVTALQPRPTNVLDVGCGEAFTQILFNKLGIKYDGVTLGLDVVEAQEMGRNVKQMDFHFLDYPDNSFDLVFSRHSLEHSPAPLLALFEWRRVCRGWMILILPDPGNWGWAGKNHYSVMSIDQIKFLLGRAGFRAIWQDTQNGVEYRFLCERCDEVTE